jgi:uncharacterized protein DUF2513
MESPLVEDIIPPSLTREDEMQRDADLIRELLLKLEARPMRRGEVVDISPDDEDIAVHGYDPDQIDYHLSQIRKKGYIDDGGSHPAVGIGFRCLTPDGHDFLDSVRDPETWAKTRRLRRGLAASLWICLRTSRRASLKRRSRIILASSSKLVDGKYLSINPISMA